jgi:hypothetical protein
VGDHDAPDDVALAAGRVGDDRAREALPGDLAPRKVVQAAYQLGCCDHRAMIADEHIHRHAMENIDQIEARAPRRPWGGNRSAAATREVEPTTAQAKSGKLGQDRELGHTPAPRHPEEAHSGSALPAAIS